MFRIHHVDDVGEVNDIEAGSVVNEGQPLFRIDDREYLLTLERARALVDVDRASTRELIAEESNLKKLIRTTEHEVRVTGDERTRVSGLFEQGSAAKKEFDFANLAYQYSRRRIDEEGYRADLMSSAAEMFPALIVGGGLLYWLPVVPLRLGLDGYFVAERGASSSNILQNGEAYELPAYFIMGAVITTTDLQLIDDRKTFVSFSAKNLLDERGPDPGFGGVDYPLASRTLFLSFQQQF